MSHSDAPGFLAIAPERRASSRFLLHSRLSAGVAVAQLVDGVAKLNDIKRFDGS
jgi:hypothetical protein